MRTGWTNKEAGPILGLDPGPKGTYPKVSDAMNPAFVKVAKLMRADPHKTLRQILETMDSLPPESEPTISDSELQQRIDMQTGRMDRARLHPR